VVYNNYSKQDCIEALSKAAEILGEHPSQAQYKELDISPSYQTISKKFGRWNTAKEELDMRTNKPSHLKYQNGCPDILNYTEEEWENLSKNMRFRRRSQATVANIKLDQGCEKCGYDDHPASLSYHHRNPDEKFKDISTMITQGYSNQRIKDEIDKCDLYCRNCHQKLENQNIYDI
jgi:hypothetical protein